MRRSLHVIESQILSQASRSQMVAASVRPWSHGRRCRSSSECSSAHSPRASLRRSPRKHHRVTRLCRRPRRASRSSLPRARPATAWTARARLRPSSASICRCPTVTTFQTSPTARRTLSNRWATGWPSRIAVVRCAALDRHMPAFGDALVRRPDRARRQVSLVVLRRSRLAARRPEPAARVLHREGVPGKRNRLDDRRRRRLVPRRSTNELVYEHRIGSRWQYEITVPFGVQQTEPGGAWSRGLGDVEVALRRTLYASVDRGSIFAAGGAVDAADRQGGARPRQRLHDLRAVCDVGSDRRLERFRADPCRLRSCRRTTTRGRNEGVRADGAWLHRRTGSRVRARMDADARRCSSPKPEGGVTEWDVVPQAQVSLSKLQHVLVSVGVRVPINERRGSEARRC